MEKRNNIMVDHLKTMICGGVECLELPKLIQVSSWGYPSSVHPVDYLISYVIPDTGFLHFIVAAIR